MNPFDFPREAIPEDWLKDISYKQLSQLHLMRRTLEMQSRIASQTLASEDFVLRDIFFNQTFPEGKRLKKKSVTRVCSTTLRNITKLLKVSMSIWNTTRRWRSAKSGNMTSGMKPSTLFLKPMKSMIAKGQSMKFGFYLDSK